MKRISQWLLALPILVLSTETFGAVQLRTTIPPAEPGQEVVLELRLSTEELLSSSVIHVDISRSAVEFLRVETEGTALAPLAPANVRFDPVFQGRDAFVAFFTLGDQSPIAMTGDVPFVKLVLRVRPDAPIGAYPIRITDSYVSVAHTNSLPVVIAGEAVVTVAPPRGPRPVKNLTCAQVGNEAVLTWEPTEEYDGLVVRQDGTRVAALEGDTTTYKLPVLPGPVGFEVLAVTGGKESIPAVCSLVMDIPRPAPIAALRCESVADGVQLSWKNATAYDTIAVFRNDRLIAELSGVSQSYRDDISPELFTVYTTVARFDGTVSLPTECRYNEFSEVFVLEAEDVRAMPGETVPVRIFATNPRDTKGFSIGLRVPTDTARMRELSLRGTRSESVGPDLFAYPRGALERGEVTLVLAFDVFPPYGNPLPAGARQHVLTALIEISLDVPGGTEIPVELGTFEGPVSENVFTVPTRENPANVESVLPRLQSGVIVVGQSPVAEVKNLQASITEEVAPIAQSGTDAGVQEEGVHIEWTNADAYDKLLVERDGEVLAEVPGERTTLWDPEPGPGRHRYRVTATKDGTESFRVDVEAAPAPIPRAFLRGDSNDDQAVDLSDATTIINWLLLDGPPPACLDAADANDSGEVNTGDALAIMGYLFLGGDAPPAPGTESPWFDPTADELDSAKSER